MYRILLVDDEGLELNALKFLVEKNFGDELTVHTAKSGRAAIELCESLRPDIVIMDVQMPGINGIDAMREIRRNNSTVKLVVLSAYDKFDYAQESISLGVSSYLTKPIRREVVLQTLRTLMGEIYTERQRRSSNLLMREKLENSVPMLEAGLLYSILLRQERGIVQNYMQLLDIPQTAGYFVVLDYPSGDSPDGEVQLVRDYDRIASIIKEFFPRSIGQLMGRHSLTVVFCQKPEDEYANRLQIIGRVTELQMRIQQELGLTFSCGVGTVRPLDQLADSYDEAISALRESSDTVAHFNDLPLSKQWEEGYPQEEEYQLYDAAKEGNIPLTMQKAESFFDWMATHQREHVSDIKLKTLELVMRAEYIAFHAGGQTYRFMQRHGYLETVQEFQTLEALRAWYLRRIQDAVSSISSAKTAQNLSTVEMARQYIDQNYSGDLTLNDVSAKVHISPYYFSKLFKEETGQNFIEYLTKVRMEEAKRQLSATAVSIKEVCRNVGYSDPNYFSRSFKKYTGMTPKEYREGGEV